MAKPSVHFKKTISRSIEIAETSRVMQMSGMFDVAPAAKSEQSWEIDFALPAEWNVGVIVGPSGSGKSTIAGELFGASLVAGHQWPRDKSILDGFPAKMSIKDIVGLLSSVGFSSPPAWMRPFHVLSNGQQFRVNLARTLAELVAGRARGSKIEDRGSKENSARSSTLDPRLSNSSIAIVDEFGSFVQAQVRQVAAAAVAKTVRRYGLQFIAVGCHVDMVDWFDPCWVLEVAADGKTRFRENVGPDGSRGSLWRRPKIELKIVRSDRSAWDRLFAGHHYLSGNLHQSAACFVGMIGEVPAAFTAVLNFPHATKSGWRESRTVCVPDFQGVGVGNAMSEAIASIYAATGRPYMSTTSHPAMIRHRAKSPLWKMTRRPGLTRPHRGENTQMSGQGSCTRMTAGFEYVGPANREAALRFGIVKGASMCAG